MPKHHATAPKVRLARPGFTLVELLVVITIIGILMSLLLPAVQSARETGRSAQCANNVRNLGMAALQHVDLVGFFPSDGWGYDWIGDPDRGYGAKQPGSWVYNILPFIEQKNLWSLGSGIPSDSQNAAKQAALTPQANTALAIYYCPSRREVMCYPYNVNSVLFNGSATVLGQTGAAKCDYAINAGDAGVNESAQPGPPTLAAGDAPGYLWFSTTKLTGVSFQRSQITLAHLGTKGASNEYLIGEKYLDPDIYVLSKEKGDNESATSGFDNDTTRTADTSSPTTPDIPMQDTPGFANESIFGSAHQSTFHMVFCDGSVHAISYTIDAKTHGILANRNAPLAVDPTKIQ